MPGGATGEGVLDTTVVGSSAASASAREVSVASKTHSESRIEESSGNEVTSVESYIAVQRHSTQAGWQL